MLYENIVVSFEVGAGNQVRLIPRSNEARGSGRTSCRSFSSVSTCETIQTSFSSSPRVVFLLRLTRHRVRSGQKQESVARYMGCSASTISRLESGESNPTLWTLTRYATAIGGQFVFIGTPLGSAMDDVLDLHVNVGDQVKARPLLLALEDYLEDGVARLHPNRIYRILEPGPRVTAHEVIREEEPPLSPADPASPEGTGDWVLVDEPEVEPTTGWTLLEDEETGAEHVRAEPGDTDALNAGA